MSQLAETVSLERPALLVANTLPWTCTVPVRIELDDAVHACDRDGTPLPEDRSAPVDGVCQVDLQVAGVPAFGYVALPLRPDPARRARGDTFGIPTTPPAAGGGGPSWDELPPRLSTRHYDVELDVLSGAVRGLVHRRDRSAAG
jgi:hypothetical protein